MIKNNKKRIVLKKSILKNFFISIIVSYNTAFQKNHLPKIKRLLKNSDEYFFKKLDKY